MKRRTKPRRRIAAPSRREIAEALIDQLVPNAAPPKKMVLRIHLAEFPDDPHPTITTDYTTADGVHVQIIEDRPLDERTP